MASNRIKGITIEIDGNVKPLTEALAKVDKTLAGTQSQLRDVNKLLKMDPSNVELLRQKQELLNKSVANSKEKVEELEAALKGMGDRTEKNAEQYDAIQREIIACKQDQAKWNAELAAMEPKVKTIGDKFKDISDKTGVLAEKTKGLSLAAGAAGAGMLGMAYKAGQTADELLTTASVTGFSVEELQKLKYASDLVDVSYESMTGSITKVTKSMSSGSKAFDKLGVSIRNEDGSMRSAVDVWYESIEALGKVENETERDQIAMELFGKSAMEMAGITDDGGQKLKELGQQAEAAGLIMGEDAVQGAGKFNDAIDTLKARAGASFASAGAALAETLIPALEKLVEIVSKVLSWFANLDGTTQTVILTVLGLVAALSPVLTLISTITTAMPALSAAFAFITGPVGLVIAAVTALVAIGVALYKNWDVIKAKAEELWDKVKTVFENIKNGIKERVEAIKTSVTNAFEKVKEAITRPIEKAKEIVAGIVQKIKDLFSFRIELPHIKLPHFGITPKGWTFGDLLKGSIPRLGIEWYAKAMQNGVVLDHPTIFGMQDGKLLGGGEAGREVVIGESSLKAMLRNAGAGTGAVNVSVTVNGNVENYDALAETIGQKLQQQMARAGRAFA